MTRFVYREPTRAQGVFSRDALHTVWLMYHARPVPMSLPDKWKDLLHPRLDEHGRIVDWVLSPSQVTFHTHLLRDEADAIWHWRTEWAAERAIGDLATVEMFLEWARPRADVSKLIDLGRNTHIDVDDVPSLAWQIHQAADVFLRSDDKAIGVVATDTGRLIRGITTCGGSLPLLIGSQARIDATEDSLFLTWRLPAPSGSESSAAGQRVIELRGWTYSDAGVVVHGPDGELNLGQGEAAQLLSRISSAARDVRVEAVPVKSMFAYLLNSVAEIARLANVARRTLFVRISDV